MMAPTLLIAAFLLGFEEPSWQPQAERAFGELERACRQDAGRLWGHSLCGPMLVVDPDSRRIVANSPDSHGVLESSSGVFVGELPPEIGIANTAVEWSGKRWAMVMLPLPDSPRALRRLLIHESWHRIQASLGLPAEGMIAPHLERPEARLWLRLEWRALEAALQSKGDARRQAVTDLLHFRCQRAQLHARAMEAERALELNEGLAEYTGLVLGSEDDFVSTAAEALTWDDDRKSLARSFAYASGPAYGLLLDQLDIGWKQKVRPQVGFGELLAEAIGETWPITTDSELAESRGSKYGYSAVRREELRLAEERSRMLEDLRRRLFESPGLVLPLEDMKMQFDPGQIVSLEPHGTVYHRLSVQDRWGSVEIDSAALISTDFSSLSLPGEFLVESRSIVGDRWRVELASGWLLLRRDGAVATLVEDVP